MVLLNKKVEWRCVSVKSGAVSVIMDGTQLMAM